jgi:hypothetical protein
MRDDWDGRYKELVQEVLRGTGEVLVGVETATPTQRMDVVYRPDAAHRAERLQRGLLGRLTEAPESNIEPYRNTPSVVRVRDDLRRVWGYHNDRSLARGEKVAPEAMTPLLVLSPGVPRKAILGFTAKPVQGFPAGVYASDATIGLWVVVVAELPATRDTLALRLMGRGHVLDAALAELGALPAEAWEHTLFEILLRWRQEIAALPTRSQRDEDFMETTRETFEQFKERARQEGRQEGETRGVSRGLQPLQHQFARRLGRPLTEGETATLLARFDTVGPDRLGDVVLDLTPDALAAWLTDPEAR